MVRLSDHDLKSLRNVFLNNFLEGDRLWLFGSRADLSRRGGDIDLYIESYLNSPEEAIEIKHKFIYQLEEKIGEQKIDVVLNLMKYPHPLPIHKVALIKGVRII